MQEVGPTDLSCHNRGLFEYEFAFCQIKVTDVIQNVRSSLSAAISPLFCAIPINPLRALFPYAAKPNMQNLWRGHPLQHAYDLDGLVKAAACAAKRFQAWTYGPSAGDPQLIGVLRGLIDPVPDGFCVLVTWAHNRVLMWLCAALSHQKTWFWCHNPSILPFIRSAPPSGSSPFATASKGVTICLRRWRKLLPKVG
jgi:hypothetical protein